MPMACVSCEINICHWYLSKIGRILASGSLAARSSTNQ